MQTMQKEPTKVMPLKTRYITVYRAGKESYAEHVCSAGVLQDYLKTAQARLAVIRTAMPGATWTMTVEEQWLDSAGDTYHQLMDVDSGAVQESVL